MPASKFMSLKQKPLCAMSCNGMTEVRTKMYADSECGFRFAFKACFQKLIAAYTDAAIYGKNWER